jgi:hypothetical protein
MILVILNPQLTGVSISIFLHGLRKTLSEQKKTKLGYRWHFMENKTKFKQHNLKMQYISSLPKYTKLISRGVFPRAFLFGNTRI